MKKLLHLLLAALGFATVASGCDEPEQDERLLCMYGPPMTGYTVKGRVVDAGSQPINGIKVEAVKIVLKDVSPVIEWKLDGAATTDKNGDYVIELDVIGNVFPESTDVVFSYEDVDGKDNGGEFAKKEETFNPDNLQSADENGNSDSYYEFTLPDTVMQRVGAESDEN